MTIAELHDPIFLERIKRSAAYFKQTLETVLSKPLALVPDIKSQNKQAMKRLTENYAELHQAWLSRCYLFKQMSEHTFTIADYLRQKQLSLLDAMDTDSKRNAKQNSGKRKRKTKITK